MNNSNNNKVKTRGKASFIPPPLISLWLRLDYAYLLWSPPTTTMLPLITLLYNCPLGGELTKGRQDNSVSILVSPVCAGLLGGAMVDRKEKVWGWIRDARHWGLKGVGYVEFEWEVLCPRKLLNSSRGQAGSAVHKSLMYCGPLAVTQGRES